MILIVSLHLYVWQRDGCEGGRQIQLLREIKGDITKWKRDKEILK